MQPSQIFQDKIVSGISLDILVCGELILLFFFAVLTIIGLIFSGKFKNHGVFRFLTVAVFLR